MSFSRIILGRSNECKQLDELLAAVRAGESRSLAIHGEAGVGKTTLLKYLVGQAKEFHVVSITGVEAEMELAFAGLHQLCSPKSEHLGALPPEQRDALQGALGLGSVRPPDRFLVALATLGLLAEAARERPLLCVVDDAQWADHASMQAFAFTARRLRRESVGFVFAVRTSDLEPWGTQEPTGIPHLALEGLPEDEARSLLSSVLPNRWDPRVIDRIVAEARGIPLALVELPKESTPTETAGGFRMPRVRPTERVQAVYADRISKLPPATRQFLLAAAADPTGEPVLLWRAAEQLGLGMSAASAAIAIGLIKIDGRVRFSHPAVRSTVYWEATYDERCLIHRVLAQATNHVTDPDRHAWHAAQGAQGPDELIAACLESSAGRAQERGGLAAAAAFLARAVELTPDPAHRQQRAMAAARASQAVGAPDNALRLLSVAEASPVDERQSGELNLLRGQIAFSMDRGSDAHVLLLRAARQLEPHDPRLARETYLEAINAAMFAGPLAHGGGQLAASQAALAGPPRSEPPTPADLLLDGTAVRIVRGHAAGVATLQKALSALRAPELSDEDALRLLWAASSTAVGLWDHESWDELSARHLRVARRTGQAAVLPLALTQRVALNVYAGELAVASSLADEVTIVCEAVGTPPLLYGALLLTAWEGREAEVAKLIRTAEAEAQRRGEGNGPVMGGLAKAILSNSLGRYEDALVAGREASKGRSPLEFGAATWALSEYIEAAARLGVADEVADALHRLVEVTGPSGTDWALGIEARCRALVSNPTEADAMYREAIERLGRTRVRGELARAHLQYGEWLRRKSHRSAAREQLRTAYDLFTSMGMTAFAERAARELQTIGEAVRRNAVTSRSELTAQEYQIVRFVREGLTNAEIGTRLFISPRTVEWHLRKIFKKLGLSSRRQLRSMTNGSSG